MGDYIHRTIIVTGFKDGIIEAAHEATRMLLKERSIDNDLTVLLTPITDGVANGYRSFFIAPDGGKTGGEMGNLIATVREEITTLLNNYKVEWADIKFGLDSMAPPKVVAASDYWEVD